MVLIKVRSIHRWGRRLRGMTGQKLGPSLVVKALGQLASPSHFFLTLSFLEIEA
jgi:hypothetical protein